MVVVVASSSSSSRSSSNSCCCDGGDGITIIVIIISLTFEATEEIVHLSHSVYKYSLFLGLGYWCGVGGNIY